MFIFDLFVGIARILGWLAFDFLFSLGLDALAAPAKRSEEQSRPNSEKS